MARTLLSGEAPDLDVRDRAGFAAAMYRLDPEDWLLDEFPLRRQPLGRRYSEGRNDDWLFCSNLNRNRSYAWPDVLD